MVLREAEREKYVLARQAYIDTWTRAPVCVCVCVCLISVTDIGSILRIIAIVVRYSRWLFWIAWRRCCMRRLRAYVHVLVGCGECKACF